MREGLVPSSITHVMRITADEKTTTTLAARLGEMLDADENAVAAFEAPNEQDWLLEVFFSQEPDEALVRELVTLALPNANGRQAAAEATFSSIVRQDWVSTSLAGLKPVRAGRFVIHGSHDQHIVRSNEYGILIEAALAFGTGHHGTTLGCLRLLEQELKRMRPRRILDVGTGTGVLAIAASLATKQRVAAGDIDPVSVLVARDNARINSAGCYVRPVTARGVCRADLKAGKPYDLVFANILAKPLRGLAPDIARLTSRAGGLILSGLLHKDVPGVLSSYRGQGFALSKELRIDGWSSLLLRRGGSAPLKANHI